MTDAVETKFTKADILTWPASEMLKRMRDPEDRAEIERIFNEPEVDPAIAEAAAAEAAAIEAQRVADELKAAEDAEPPVEEVAPVVVPTVVHKKLIVEYQATDPGSGQPIGRPTHLETVYIEGDKESLIKAYEEMSEKQKTAHINATQALENIKKRKITLKDETPVPAKIGLTEEEVKQLASELDDDPEKAAKKAEAIRKLSNADATEQREREAAEAKELALVERATYSFMKKHLTDFYQCQANSDIITNWIVDNKMAWTEDNLEAAFEANESNLAPVPRPEIIPAQVPVVVQTPPVVPVQPIENIAPPAAPIVAAIPVEVATPVAPANPVAPARRLPNGGLQPGTMTGRPLVNAPAVGPTKQDILKMPRDEYKQKIRDPKFRAMVNALWA